MVSCCMKKFDNFCRALDNLKTARNYEEPYDTVTQTGIIALFEICFEQSWKVMKAVLEEHGRSPQKTGSPRMIIKLAFSAGMIDNEEIWLELLKTRNTLAHTCDEEMAVESIKVIKSSYIGLFEKLKDDIGKIWLCECYPGTDSHC